MNRKESLEKLRTEEFDICIIGAGASGAGAALDATLRGFKVALIDKNDFSSETSSKSTKLIHGGVRYLERAFKQLDLEQLKQVRHGLHERKTLLALAPHLAKPIALITPVFSWLEGMYFTIGLKIYGLFAIGDKLPNARWLSKKETLMRMPGLTDKMHSSVLYYDGTFDDSRYCLAMVQSAVKQGATVANYLGLTSFVKDNGGKLKEAVVKDECSGEFFNINSKLFINCTGPFSDTIRLLAEPNEESRMRPAKGVHITFSSKFLPSKDAMLIPETKDGRVVFVKPLGDKVTVGTTDTPYENMGEEPKLESQEIDYLLETLAPFLKHKLERKDVLAGFAGVRPLLAPKGSRRKETKALLRDHEVEHLESSNLLNLLGGKWTTYRVMAQDVIDKASQLLGRSETCTTASHNLVGNQKVIFDKELFKKEGAKKGLAIDTLNHLLDNYGDEADTVLAYAGVNNDLKERVLPEYPFIKAEVVYSLRNEMCIKLRDFLSRRVRLEMMDWKSTAEAIDIIAPYFVEELGWNKEELLSEKEEYKNLLQELRKSAAI